MEMRKIKKVENVIFDKERKNCKYGIIENNEVIYVNGGRVKEYYIRSAYGYTKLDLENVPHWVAGDIDIDGIPFNVKSYKAELKADGITIEEKIENYIAADASNGMIYVIEHNEEIIEIRMNWDEVREFMKNFAKLDRGNIRITTCDNKIYNWATSQVA